MHVTAISVAEGFKLKEDIQETDTSIKSVEVGKEEELEKNVTQALLVVSEEKDISVHEA